MLIRAAGTRTRQSRVLATAIVVAFGSLLAGAQKAPRAANKTVASGGTCNVAHSGNNDVITIKNCGIGAEEADKIVAMLKAVLANQQADSRDAKLDELLDLARRAANPYRTIATYDPNGWERLQTPSTGEVNVVSGGKDAYIAMLQAQNAGDSVRLEALSRQAIDTYPAWFTPWLFLGVAQANQCEISEAKLTLTKFINDTESAAAYQDFRDQAQKALQRLDDPDIAARCTQRKAEAP